MNNTATPIEVLFEKAENYSKTSLELIRLKVLDKSADSISSLATQLIIFLVVALFVMLLSIGCSLWIGSQLGRFYYGFFVVGGIYVFLAIVIYTFRIQLLKQPINNAIIAKIEKQEEDETK